MLVVLVVLVLTAALIVSMTDSFMFSELDCSHTIHIRCAPLILPSTCDFLDSLDPMLMLTQNVDVDFDTAAGLAMSNSAVIKPKARD